jgi:hypothetical protein
MRSFRNFLSWLPIPRAVRLPTDPVSPTWPTLIHKQVPIVARLSQSDQDRLFHIMQLFFREVPIEGCRGMELTEEMCLTIGAQACLLLLRMPYPRYTGVRRVLVYPSSFIPPSETLHPSGELVHPDEPLDGEAWQGGVVVLGWDAVQRATGVVNHGENVVFHEFAHMLDAEDGHLDGVPVFDSRSAYRAWTALLSQKFAEHSERVERGDATILDPYGSENRAEFFAVATEAYFTRPTALRKEQPALYELLLDFYKIDPGLLIAAG